MSITFQRTTRLRREEQFNRAARLDIKIRALRNRIIRGKLRLRKRSNEEGKKKSSNTAASAETRRVANRYAKALQVVRNLGVLCATTISYPLKEA